MGKPLDFTFYNPDQLEDQDFLAGFVARQDLVDKIVARLGNIKHRGMAQHRLLVGQRGMGKTSLLRRIGLEVRDQPALAEVLLPLRFREEQYNVHNLHVFWCNCLDALGDWFEAAGRRDDAERLDRAVAVLNAQEDDEEGNKALELFRAWMKEEQRRPLLLLDNLDIIFTGLKNVQWSLRRLLQEAGGIVVIGASAAALEAAANREGAFYDFFQVDLLAKLEHHEILLCLRHMAQQRNEYGKRVLQILDRDPARIHVLYDLTGGNPRTLAMLYLVLETSGDEDVMRDLERLLDQATPLYKARVEELAPQTRVVFDALSLAWNPATAADLAGVTGLEVGVVSAQLDRMLKEGVVEKTSLSSTHRTAFQVAERFFNIWYLMRHSSRRQRQRLRWLTEMLRRIYSPRELRERATGLLVGPGSEQISSAAYCLALSDAVEDRELRLALRRSVLRQSVFDPESDLQLEDELSLSPRSPRLAPNVAETVAGKTAAATYRKAIERHPSDPGLWNGLGKLLLDLPELNGEAEGAFLRAIALDAKDAQPWNNLGRLLASSQERQNEAEAAYHKAIELDPKSAARPWSNLGRLLESSPGRHVEAEAAYRKAIELDPMDAAPWNDLGILLAVLFARYSEAEAAYRKAIQLDTQDPGSWNNLGILLAGPLERHAEAEVIYRKAIELSPTYAELWNNLGALLSGPLARYAESEAAFRKAIALGSKLTQPWINLGKLLGGPLERYAEAEAAFRQAIELDSQDVQLWIDLGRLLAGPLENRSEAEASYRKALELDSKLAHPWTHLGILLAAQPDRQREAEDAFRKAIELDPKSAWHWSNLGVLLAALAEHYAEAEAAFRKAIELDPKYVEAWMNLGRLLADSLGRYSEAEVAYREAIKIVPKNPILWNTLGDLLAGPQQRHVEAEAAYRKAVELDPKDARAWNSLGNLLADHLFRLEEAERAYCMATRIDPQSFFTSANLAYLLLREDGSRADAETYYRFAINQLPPHGAGLLRAFHALATDNFGTATTELQKVLDEGHPELFTVYRDDLQRILKFAAERGLGDKLLEWLKNSDFSGRYWPLQVAFEAYLHGEERLMDVNPEVRSGARRLLSEMTRRPNERPQPEPGKKLRGKKGGAAKVGRPGKRK